MAETSKIAGEIQVEQTTREAVAFKLMEHISHYEPKVEKDNRRYWLALYRQCYKATRGGLLESILKED